MKNKFNSIKIQDFFKKNFLRFISYLLFGIAIFYVFQQIKENWLKLGEGVSYFNKKFFIFYLLILQIYFLYQINIWKLILNKLGTKINFLKASYMYYSCNLLAYTPGKIANAIGMASLAKEYKISISNTVTTVILFQIYSLISGTFLISLFSLFSDKTSIDNLYLDNLWILFIASFIGLILIYPSFQNFTLTTLKKLTKKDINNPNNSFILSIFQILLYGIGWVIYCFSITFLIKTFSFDINLSIYPYVVIILIASYLSGLLAFVVPAGFGILEAGLLYGFSSLLNINEIILITIVFRLGNIISTLLGWLVLKAYLFHKEKI